MAPPESAYFPALDQCLAGSERLISWSTAYCALSSSEPAVVVESTALEAFLTDPESINVLTNSLDPFLKASAKTKGDFETKTAPIHVSQSANGDYDLDELKKDAVWLSEQVGVEELAALRVAIVEWQQRAEDQLMVAATGNSGAAAMVSRDLGASALGRSTLSFTASTNGNAAPALDCGREEVRRSRLLQLFLEEKNCILRIGTELVNRIAIKDLEAKTARNWIDDLAGRIVDDQCSTQDASEHETFCTSCMEIVEGMIVRVDDASKRPSAFKSDELNQVVYIAATFRDMTNALRLLLANLYMLQGVPGLDVVSTWFKLMSRVNFFQSLSPTAALPDPSALQSLVSVISLTVLRAPEVIIRIQESAMPTLEDGVQYPQLPSNSYFQNDACIKEVNLILYRAAQENLVLASPAIYAWTLITTTLREFSKLLQEVRERQRPESSDSETAGRRRSSRRDSTEEMSACEKQFEVLKDFEIDVEDRDDPPSFLARAAVDGMDVYAVVSRLSKVVTATYGSSSGEATSFFTRDALFSLVREGMQVVSYGAEVLDSILDILSPDVHDRSTNLDLHLANRFLSDHDVFRGTVLEQALARYPFELSPLLKLFSALSLASSNRTAGPSNLVQLLESLQTMTIMVPNNFKAYQLDHEDENLNGMLLIDLLPVFISKQSLSLYGSDFFGRRALTMGSGEGIRSNVLAISSGAAGIVVKESRPLVFKLEYPHSGLEYLGLLLATLLPNSELVMATMDADLDRSTAAEIITLITGLLNAPMRQHHGIEEARFVLGRLGYALHDEQDIVSIIADILEMELLAHLDQSIQEGSLELLVACAEFFDKVTSISPERVWSTIARSSLLGISGGANALAAVVGGREVQTGRYRFLAACARMYSHLIDDAIAGLLKRRVRVDKATNRFDSPMSSQDSTPERTMSTVLNSYQTVVLDAWQSLEEWRFAVQSEREEIVTLILSAFERLLKSTYGVGESATAERRLSAMLMPSASAIIDSFDGNETLLRSFAALFAIGLDTADNDLAMQQRRSHIEQGIAASTFLTALIRTTRLIDQSGKRVYSLASQLIRLTPILASLLATDYTFKATLSNLLAEIVQAVNDGSEDDPPSLLGQMSADTSKSFLSVISQLDRPLCDIQVESSVWRFLSTVMTSKQQWFAMYLLTGALPKDRLKDRGTNGSKTKGRSLLAYALDQLSDIATLATERAMGMLQFVAAAQNSWVWATNEVRSHPDFLKNALDWLSNLQAPSRSPNMAQEQLLASEHQMAAYLCDILAVNLHASLEIGDKSVLKLTVPKIGFLRQHGASVDAYNRSLHRNLAENFARKFNGCEVDDFRRTAANPAPFGKDHCFDLNLASRVLGHDVAWAGSISGRTQGFAEEFARANVNLSLVEAQARLLKSWRVLSTALSECAEQDATLQGELAQAAAMCLRASVEANLEQPGMDEIVNTRAEMAFVMTSKLVGVKAEDPAIRDLLPAAWALLRASPVDYDVATVLEDLQYYRTLLQVLYLAIQPHAYMKPASSSSSLSREPQASDETKMDFLDPAVAAPLVEIVAKIIGPGFRALCGNLHNSMDIAQPGDFALLTALLQAILSVQGVAAVHPQIAKTVADSSIVRGALSLYSWADQLAEVIDQDPIYGEVAVMFLLSLSTIRPVAEQMALDGALVQLSSANLSHYFRKPGGKGPFDEPRRMFVIWTEAFLPLCLNLLDAVGPRIAAEVATFLNSFPQQLRRAETSLENRDPSLHSRHAGAVTLSLVSEAHSLCLVSLILASDTARAAAEGINAADIPTLAYDYQKVKDDASGLMRQKTSLAARIVPVGEREDAWIVSSSQGASDNLLQGKVVREVVGLLGCFGQDS